MVPFEKVMALLKGEGGIAADGLTIQEKGLDGQPCYKASQWSADGLNELLMRHALAIHFPSCCAAPGAVFHVSRNNGATNFLSIEFC